MNVEIHESPLEKQLYGRSKEVQPGQRPGEVMFVAMEETWTILREHKIPNAGINHILYSGNRVVFAGVESTSEVDPASGLEQIDLMLPRYASYRHLGGYDLLPSVYEQIQAEIAARGWVTGELSMEIYGHWDPDPAKQVTTIMLALD